MTTDLTEVHLHVTGSVSAALVPWWVHWLRAQAPDLIINMSVTRGARRFVTVPALRSLANGSVWIDDWDDDVPDSPRLGKSGSSQCFIVFPATLDTLMRLAQGRADTPALMMLQCTDLPIVVADSRPTSNEVIDFWAALLSRRSNVGFAPLLETIRASDRSTTTSGFNLPGALRVAEELVAQRTPSA